MATHHKFLGIASLCFLWCLISASANVTNKGFFKAYGLPLTVSLAQLISNMVYLPILLRFWQLPTSASLFTASFYARKLIPLAFVKLMVTTMSNISVSRVSVSYAHTVKALLPFFTVLLSRLILKEKQSWKVYLSLLPIVAGVMLASVTELSFDVIGLISALLCGFFLAFQSVFSKKILVDSDIHRFHLLFRLAQLAGLFVLPFWLWRESGRALDKSNCNKDIFSPECVKFCSTLLFSGGLNFIQNLIAFTVLSLVSSLSYAVASNVKRVVVITVSILVFHNRVTQLNALGMAVTIGGAILYNKFLYGSLRKRAVLPVVRKDTEVRPNGTIY